MVLKEFLKRMREKKEAFREVQTNDRVQTMVQERKKNSNERELERYMEEDRQKMIKSQLEMYRNRKKIENRKVTTLDKKNIFKNHDPILKHDEKLFGMNSHHKNIMLHKGGMFFK
jgi:DNA-binding transcriptional regulator GbsR (MarR family)